MEPCPSSWSPALPMVPPNPKNRAWTGRRTGLLFLLGWSSLSLWKPKTILQLLGGRMGLQTPVGPWGLTGGAWTHLSAGTGSTKGGSVEGRRMACLLPSGRRS